MILQDKVTFRSEWLPEISGFLIRVGLGFINPKKLPIQNCNCGSFLRNFGLCMKSNLTKKSEISDWVPEARVISGNRTSGIFINTLRISLQE